MYTPTGVLKKPTHIRYCPVQTSLRQKRPHLKNEKRQGFFPNDPSSLKISQNELLEGVHKSTIRLFWFEAEEKIFRPKMAILGRFWLFWPFFRQFFNAKITRSQNKGNSYYKNLENNILLDFVIRIFPILFIDQI